MYFFYVILLRQSLCHFSLIKISILTRLLVFYTRISVVDVLEMEFGSGRMRNVSGVKMEIGWVILRWFSQ